MGAESWMLLTDYSSKYRISVSTLRRRIKADQIRFRFDNGKYFLLDTPPQESIGHVTSSHSPTAPLMQMMTLAEQPRLAGISVPLKSPFAVAPGLTPLQAPDVPKADEAAAEFDKGASRDEPIIATATKLLNELKRAYMSILQEKEEQLIQLKEEVSDLKTLVRVLEDDNERLRQLLNIRP